MGNRRGCNTHKVPPNPHNLQFRRASLLLFRRQFERDHHPKAMGNLCRRASNLRQGYQKYHQLQFGRASLLLFQRQFEQATIRPGMDPSRNDNP